MLEKLDVVLPEVTRHAFYIQKYNNAWQQASRETEGVYEYIVAQLLDIAKILDYADEIGRRKMFMLLRMYLSENEPMYCCISITIFPC